MATAIALPRQPHSNWLARLRTIQLGIGARGAVGHGLARQRGGAAGNGLLNSLVAYWPLNEASGDALDAHTNGLTLTQVGSPGSVTGHIYSGARETYAALQTDKHFYRSDALLRPGDEDFTFAAWVNLTATGQDRGVFGTWEPDPNSEFLLLHTSTEYISWLVTSSGNPAVVTAATSALPIATAQWYLLVCWHDAANNQIGLQINNGTAVTTPHTTGVATVSGTFRLGRFWIDDGARHGRVWRGAIGPVAFWKSAAGGGVLTAAQRTALYNSGAGLAYAAFTT